LVVEGGNAGRNPGRKGEFKQLKLLFHLPQSESRQKRWREVTERGLTTKRKIMGGTRYRPLALKKVFRNPAPTHRIPLTCYNIGV